MKRALTIYYDDDLRMSLRSKQFAGEPDAVRAVVLNALLQEVREQLREIELNNHPLSDARQ